MSIVADALAVAEELRAGGVDAYVDPTDAANNRPCVLVAPPERDYTRLATSWRLVALSSRQVGSLASLEELAALVDDVNELLPIETAAPASYQLTADAGPVPAYVLRYTT